MLWTAFDTYYDAQLYKSLIRVRLKEKNKHELCVVLGDYLDAIKKHTVTIRCTYREIIKETVTLASNMKIARARLMSAHEQYWKEYDTEMDSRREENKTDVLLPRTSAASPAKTLRL